MTIFVVGAYRLDDERFELTGPDGPVAVEPQVFDVLRHLLASGGALVTKEELLDSVWGDRFVSESALTSRIKQARRAIGDDGTAQRVIRTVHGRGYRVVAEVDVIERDAAAGGPLDGVPDGPPPVDPGAAGPARSAPPGDWPTPRLLPAEFRPDARRQFVGRSDELVSALQLVFDPDRDLAATIWVLGEPGIGKTRLAARTAQLAHESGAIVLFGRCSEDLSVPYQPVIEALRSHISTLGPGPIDGGLGPLAGELTRLVPELNERLPTSVPPAPADADTERYRLFEGVAGWLASLSANAPVVLVLDDLHWATDSTVQLVEHVARSTVCSSATIVVTARDTVPDESPRIARLLGTITTDPRHRVVRLGGLDAESVRSWLGTDDGVDELLALTAGNPLLIQSVAGSGALVDGPASSAPAVRIAVQRRVSSLAPGVRDTLAHAAVAGLEFHVRVLARAMHRDDLDVIGDLEQAAAARLLDEVDIETYRFSHALVRSSLRDDVSAARRARLHANIAAAIIDVHGDRLDEHRSSLAHHFAEAAEVSPVLAANAVVHLRRAAEQAIELLSFDDAVALYERAITLEPDPRPRAELLLAQGWALGRSGHNMPALATLDQAFELARSCGDAELAAEAALAFEDVSWRPGMYGGPAVQKLRWAREHTDRTKTRVQARLAVALSRALGYTGDIAAADEANREAAELSAVLDDPEIEARRLAALLTPARPEPLPNLSELVRSYRVAADRTGDIEIKMLELQVECHVAAQGGRMDDYRRADDEFGAAVAQLHTPFWHYLHACHGVLLAFYEGRLDDAERLAAESFAAAEELTGEDTSGTYGLQMYLIRREQDRLAQLGPTLELLLATNPSSRFWAPGLAALRADIGDLERAAAGLDALAADDFAAIHVDAMWTTVMAFTIDLAVTLGDRARCARLLEMYRGQSGTLVMTGHGVMTLGAADRFLGMLATVTGEWDDAEKWLHAAEELEARNGSPLFAGRARLARAQLADARGDHDLAGALATEVAADAGMRGYAALARRAGELTSRRGPSRR